MNSVDRGLGDLGSLIETGNTATLIDEVAQDATSIITARDNESRFGSLMTDVESSTGIELSVDGELARSGPYTRQRNSALYGQRREQLPLADCIPEEAPAATNTGANLRDSLAPRAQESALLSSSQDLSEGLATPFSPMSPGGQSRSSNQSTQRPVIKGISDQDIDYLRKKITKASLQPLKWHLSAKVKTRVNDLCSYIKIGDMKEIKDILMLDAYINGHDSSGNTPLFTAIIHRQLAIAEFLLKVGADVREGYRNAAPRSTSPKTRNYRVFSPLHEAAKMGYAEAVRLLVKYGADVNDASTRHRDRDFYDRLTPLSFAKGAAAQQLIDLGGNVSHSSEFSNVDPLYMATERMDVSTVRCFSQNGARVKYDRFHLKAATGFGRPGPNSAEIIKILIFSGADPNKKMSIWPKDGAKRIELDALQYICYTSFPRNGQPSPYKQGSIGNRDAVAAIQALVDGGSRWDGDILVQVIGGSFPMQDFKYRKAAARILCTSRPNLLKDQLPITFQSFQICCSNLRLRRDATYETESDVKTDIIKKKILAMFWQLTDLFHTLLNDKAPQEIKKAVAKVASLEKEATATLGDKNKRLATTLGNKLSSSLLTYVLEHGRNARRILFNTVLRDTGLEQNESGTGNSDVNETTGEVDDELDGEADGKPVVAEASWPNAERIADNIIAEFAAAEKSAEEAKQARVAELAAKISLAAALAKQAEQAAKIADEAKLAAEPNEVMEAEEMAAVSNFAIQKKEAAISPPSGGREHMGASLKEMRRGAPVTLQVGKGQR